MKVFEQQDKINFVDRHNTLVGYDLQQCCCESAGWYISEEKRTDTNDKQTTGTNLDAYVFDQYFFEEVGDARILDDGGMVRFRLVAEGKPDLYLHLFNSHNGYYAHNFVVEHSGTVVKNMWL